MPRQNSITIPPFPPDIDRFRFGDWLSGFVDGEACFYLGFHHQGPGLGGYTSSKFLIKLRFDDRPILEQVQSFFGCGTIAITPSSRSINPTCQYAVGCTESLVRIIIPHFESHPLRAKKSRDFLIWKEAVLYAWSINPSSFKVRKGKPRGYIAWTEERIRQFRSYIDALRALRLPGGIPSLPAKIEPSYPLFDSPSVERQGDI